MLNAGDGTHAHPTQALLDALTIRRHVGRLKGLRVAICGDIAHSRVARSNIELLTIMGAEVRLVAPRTLIPGGIAQMGAKIFYDMREGIKDCDVVMMLRLQTERMQGGFFPSIREYFHFFGLDTDKLAAAKPDAIVMHPGPMNRGVEIDSLLADDIGRSVIREQVEMGGRGAHGVPGPPDPEPAERRRRACLSGNEEFEPMTVKLNEPLGKVAYVNARLLDPDSELDAPGGLLTEGERIADFGAGLFADGAPADARVVDCGGLCLAPGLVDIRVHLREPGQEHKETLETTGRSAVTGGVTSLVGLPDTTPVIDDMSVLEFVARRARMLGLAKVYAYGAGDQGAGGRRTGRDGPAGAIGRAGLFRRRPLHHRHQDDAARVVLCQHLRPAHHAARRGTGIGRVGRDERRRAGPPAWGSAASRARPRSSWSNATSASPK